MASITLNKKHFDVNDIRDTQVVDNSLLLFFHSDNPYFILNFDSEESFDEAIKTLNQQLPSIEINS